MTKGSRKKEKYSPAGYATLTRIVAANPGIDIDVVQQILKKRHRFSLNKIVGVLDFGLGNDNLRINTKPDMVIHVNRSDQTGQRLGRQLYLRKDAPEKSADSTNTTGQTIL